MSMKETVIDMEVLRPGVHFLERKSPKPYVTVFNTVMEGVSRSHCLVSSGLDTKVYPFAGETTTTLEAFVFAGGCVCVAKAQVLPRQA